MMVLLSMIVLNNTSITMNDTQFNKYRLAGFIET